MEPSEETGKSKRQKRLGGRGSYGKTAKMGAAWTVARQVIKHVILVPASMVTARLLTPQEFGIAAAAGFFLTMMNRVTELGLNAALVRVKRMRQDHASSVFVVSLVLGVATWLGLFVLAPFMGRFFRTAEVSDVLRVTAFGFLVTPFSTVPSAILQRDLRFKAMSFIEWQDAAVGAIVAIVLAWMGFSYWSLVYGQLAANTVTVGVKMAFARWKPSFVFSREAFRDLWSYGIGLQIKRFLEFGAQNLDNLIVGRTLGIAALGLYDKAYTTVQRLQVTLNLGPAVSFRIFAIMQDDLARFRRAYQKVLLTIGVVAMPPLALCVVVAPQLIEVVYGRRWLATVPTFQILCIGLIIRLSSQHATRANEAKGMIWTQVRQHVVYVIAIVIGVWVGSRWGIAGVATGVLIARIILAVMINDLLRQSIDATWRDMLAPAVPGLVLSTVVAIIALAVEQVVRLAWPAISPAVLLVAQAAVVAVAYVPMVLFSPSRQLRSVVHETVQEFAPRYVKWVPAPLPDMNPTHVA